MKSLEKSGQRYQVRKEYICDGGTQRERVGAQMAPQGYQKAASPLPERDKEGMNDLETGINREICKMTQKMTGDRS